MLWTPQRGNSTLLDQQHSAWQMRDQSSNGILSRQRAPSIGSSMARKDALPVQRAHSC